MILHYKEFEFAFKKFVDQWSSKVETMPDKEAASWIHGSTGIPTLIAAALLARHRDKALNLTPYAARMKMYNIEDIIE